VRLENKVALVTGGARGIGRAIVELFAAEGATVVAADLKFDEPFENPNITTAVLDVSSEDGWRAVVDPVIEQHGRIDVLINNAGGVGSYEPIDTIAIDDWDRIIAVNQTGTFLGIRTVVPHMRANGGGSIVCVSSIWGIAGAAGVAAYTASKGAVRLMAKNAALSYVGDNIRTNSLHPGIIATPMITAQAEDITASIVDVTPMKRLGRPEEVAYCALFLASDESSFVTGAELVVDGGYTVP
jgi:NAD(P)-dependent dehydrogenase (short-subunit alcohol dehydrogenase family)